MKNTKYTRKWFSPKALKKMAYGYVNGTKIPSDIPESVQKKVIEIAKAIKFVDDYSKENKIVTERLRTYFVGETIKCNAGFEVWAPCRGKPTGTVVAIKTDWGIAVGISKIAKDEKYPIAVLGQFLALKDAIDSKNSAEKSGNYKNADEKYPVLMIDGRFNLLNNHERKQLERFILRAKAYFYPEIYSFSRGENPVSYPNYEEIHRRQLLILGEDKLKSNAPKPSKNNSKSKDSIF